jgi:hypothetical protein
MPLVGFEPMTPAYERAKTFYVLDLAATVIGTFQMILLFNSGISVILKLSRYFQ